MKFQMQKCLVVLLGCMKMRSVVIKLYMMLAAAYVFKVHDEL